MRVIQDLCEISGFSGCRAQMDLFHTAIAIEIGAEALLSFDSNQIELAEASGLSAFRLTQRSRKP